MNSLDIHHSDDELNIKESSSMNKISSLEDSIQSHRTRRDQVQAMLQQMVQTGYGAEHDNIEQKKTGAISAWLLLACINRITLSSSYRFRSY